MGTNDQRPPLSAEWGDLQQQGQVPEKGKGTTADRAEKDKERKRKRMPTEDRRRGRKISPTLPHKLIQRLKTICKTEGHVGSDGDGVIVSSIIEDLLWFAVEAYEQGELDREEVIVETRPGLRRRSGK